MFSCHPYLFVMLNAKQWCSVMLQWLAYWSHHVFNCYIHLKSIRNDKEVNCMLLANGLVATGVAPEGADGASERYPLFGYSPRGANPGATPGCNTCLHQSNYMIIPISN